MSRLKYRDEHGTAKLFQETLRRNPHAFAEKLAHYEDLEEQGRLISLPCAIGDDVYKVPSETNYKLNVLGGHEEHNKAYHQKVVAIEIKKDCWFMVGSTDAEYGTGRLFLDVDFGETWFLTKAEAERKLAELKGENNA